MKAIRSLIIFYFVAAIISSAHGSTSLNGVATYQELGREVFLAALYASEFSSPDTLVEIEQDLKIEVRATNSITKRRWVNMWMQGIAINNRQDVFEAQAENLVTLFDAFRSGLKSGDNFTLVYSTTDGASASLNGVTLITGQNWDFFRLFLQAWVGPVPPSSDFKDAILGKRPSDELAARLPTITPQENRITAVSKWMEPEEEKQETPALDIAVNNPATVPEISKPVVVPNPVAEDVPAKASATEKKAAEEKATAKEEIVAEELPEEEVIISVESLIAQQEYTNSVIKKIYNALAYPKAAIKRNMEGTVRVQLEILRDGSVQESLLAEESKYNLLNKAAANAVEKAAPFPPIPDVVPDNSLEFSIPVVFKLTD